MKKIIIKNNLLHVGRNQKGFTLVEVLVSMLILSVGLFGLIKAADLVIFYQNNSRQVTEATMKTTNKIEQIKGFSANDPTGGAFGFDYLVTSYLTNEGLTRDDDWTYSKTEQDGEYTISWQLQVFPSGEAETFDDPVSIRMIEVLVTTSWIDKRSVPKELEMASVLHRRQFIE
jgi:prepilin-type N-terminal cleavage/methylation domain-containing protein